MPDFIALTETEMNSFAQNCASWPERRTGINPPFIDGRAPLVSGPPEERRYQAAYVDNDAVTTDWSAKLTVIAHS